MYITPGFGQTRSETSFFEVSYGTLHHYKDFPSQHVPERNIDVWLPPDYDQNKAYPVLYMHDGQMLFDAKKSWNGQEWGVDEVMAQLISKNEIAPLIVVGVWNGGIYRHSEYFPQKPFESLPPHVQDSLVNRVRRNAETDLFSRQVYSDNYLKFLVEELKPFIDTTYNTLKDAPSTYIAGSSMGGLISMYAICEYPEVFGGAACLSTHWPGVFTLENNPIPDAFLQYLSENIPPALDHRFYFDHGTQTLDSLYGGIQTKADTIFIAKGYTSRNYKSLKFEGANHSEAAWNARFQIPVKFLLE
ncbi:alpha/beta hydrolase [Robertkochia marina]|nr:alpha/beta hydrolase-fold protein [Robertkochia marina]